MSDMDETLYIANPDVSCREEAPREGAILFNPDTDAVLVVNPTGLVLWRALEVNVSRKELVLRILQFFKPCFEMMLQARFADTPLAEEQQAVVVYGLQNPGDQVFTSKEQFLIKDRRTRHKGIKPAFKQTVSLADSLPE